MIDFSMLQGLSIPEGSVTKIQDASGNVLWSEAVIEPEGDAFITFTGESSNFTLTATNVEWDGTVEYFTRNGTWSTWDGTAISSSNKKLYLRGCNNTTFYTTKGAQFRLSAKAACSGNINTLLDYSNPPTTLAENCYYNMFMFTRYLTQAPELPATTLGEYCYDAMFYGCTDLTKAPELPATTLTSACYGYMFYGCTSLTQAPALPATTLATSCYYAMFYGCTSLTQAPELPVTTLANNCYYAMFQGCTNLTQAPELPATTLAYYCYAYMFQGCTGIKLSSAQDDTYTTAYRIPTTGTGTTATYALTDMFKSTGGTFTGTPEINTTYYGAWD